MRGQMVGSKQIFPGLHLDAESLCDLLATEKVSMTAGVPTIWFAILEHLDQDPAAYDLSALDLMLVGGAPAPPAMIDAFDTRPGLNVVHAWGMTETSPLGSVSHIGPRHDELDAEGRLALRAKQGRMSPFVEIRARGAEGLIPWDDTTTGELEVRGPWIASSYYRSEQGAESFTDDGWFRTGDIVNIDTDGYIDIKDRAKDVIKSGGEWISSLALENALMGHPDITEAAVIGVSHPEWVERPLAIIATGGTSAPSLEAIREYLAPHFADWWLPDAIEVVAETPRTSARKFDQLALREQFADYALPVAD
jgi:fatty-acyl-CoA synthase